VAAILRYALSASTSLEDQVGRCGSRHIRRDSCANCVRYWGGGADAACRGSHDRGHDWKRDLGPPLSCQEFLADRHGCLPRVMPRLWARADLGLPTLAGLLVRPLPVVA